MVQEVPSDTASRDRIVVALYNSLLASLPEVDGFSAYLAQRLFLYKSCRKVVFDGDVDVSGFS